MNATDFRFRFFFPAIILGAGVFLAESAQGHSDSTVSNGPTKAYISAKGVGGGWDRYIEYIHRLEGSVQTDWAETVAQQKDRLSLPEEVTVKVLLNRQGEVVKLSDFAGTESLSEPAREAVTRAVTSRPSYGRWPEEMARDLGKEREVAVDFYFPPTRSR